MPHKLKEEYEKVSHMTEVSAGRSTAGLFSRSVMTTGARKGPWPGLLLVLGMTGGWESENFHLWAGATGFESLGVPRFSDQLAQVWGRREKGSW